MVRLATTLSALFLRFPTCSWAEDYCGHSIEGSVANFFDD